MQFTIRFGCDPIETKLNLILAQLRRLRMDISILRAAAVETNAALDNIEADVNTLLAQSVQGFTEAEAVEATATVVAIRDRSVAVSNIVP